MLELPWQVLDEKIKGLREEDILEKISDTSLGKSSVIVFPERLPKGTPFTRARRCRPVKGIRVLLRSSVVLSSVGQG